MNATPPDSAGPRFDAAFWRRAGPAIAALVLFIVFVVQNAESVKIRFLWWSITTPRIIVLLGAAVIGVLTWELVRALIRRREGR